jgi:hypothetical protein
MKEEEMKSRIARSYGIVLGAVGLVCAAGTVLLAYPDFVGLANPHFVGQVRAAQGEPCGDIDVCFKEAGLGNNVRIDYEASAYAIATYHCVNNGGQCPNAANKVTVEGPVSATGTFSSGQNGQITECLTLEPPGPGTFQCPPGQSRVLADLSFSNITITDLTNDLSKAANPSSFTSVCFECP